MNEERQLPERRHRRVVIPLDVDRATKALDIDARRTVRSDNQRLFTRKVRPWMRTIVRHAPDIARFSSIPMLSTWLIPLSQARLNVVLRAD